MDEINEIGRKHKILYPDVINDGSHESMRQDLLYSI
jgi:hypothetical protein